MNNKILNVVRGLYYYYATGATSRIPYFSTISACVLVLFIHTLQISIALKRFFNISIDIPIPNVHRGIKYLILALYFAPIYFLLTRIFTLNEVEHNNLSEAQQKKNRNAFFIYAVLNIVLLLLLLSDKIVFSKR